MINSNSPLCGRILVAEDTPDTRQLLRVFLEQAGLTVDFANNGIVACQRIKTAIAAGAPHHLILMDLHMPKLDGLGAMQRLRNNGWNGPIIALTTQTLTQDRAMCLRSGFSDFMSKPIDLARLLQMIASYLEHHDSHAKSAKSWASESLRARSNRLLDDPRISSVDRARILFGFIARLQDIAVTIDQAVIEVNLFVILESAHALRGSADLLGFLQISKAAQVVEEQAHSSVDSCLLLASALRLVRLCRQTAAQYPR